jgi:hypothetical protein
LRQEKVFLAERTFRHKVTGRPKKRYVVRGKALDLDGIVVWVKFVWCDVYCPLYSTNYTAGKNSDDDAYDDSGEE